MLFDKAAPLLEEDGWYFRVIRQWLRRKREEWIVAVFAGTYAKLANFFKLRQWDNPGDSRNPKVEYRYRIRPDIKLYPPFCHFRTFGIFAEESDGQSKNPTEIEKTEIQRSFLYGRPLFALLQAPVIHLSILSRMCFDRSSLPDEDETVFFSILATCFQMGGTTWKIASKLVSRGYTYLTDFSSEHSQAEIHYLPDPRYAYLAYKLMDETFYETKGDLSFRGKSPRWWVERAVSLYSTNFCHPSRGDLGEVVVSMFLGFSADKLRCDDFKSVPFCLWIDVSFGPLSQAPTLD